MENRRALIVYGAPLKGEDTGKFGKGIITDLKIMKDLSIQNGYICEISFIDSMKEKLKQRQQHQQDKFLFYFVGHANKYSLGDKKYKTNELFEVLDGIKGKKNIFLDACVGDYEGGEKFKALKLPRNSKIVTLKESYPSKSLAKLLYGLNLRGHSLDKLNRESFEVLKQPSIYYKETK